MTETPQDPDTSRPAAEARPAGPQPEPAHPDASNQGAAHQRNTADAGANLGPGASGPAPLWSAPDRNQAAPGPAAGWAGPQHAQQFGPAHPNQTHPGQSSFGPSPYGQGGYPPPPHGGYPTPAAIPDGGRSKRKKFTVGLATLALFSLVAAGVGGAVGAYVSRDARPSSSVAAITGSNSSDTTTSVGAVAKKVLPSVVQVNETTSSVTGVGSGMVVSSDGIILTNNHVIADYASEGGTLTVTTYDGHTYNAKVIGYITADDIAVIQAENVTGWNAVSFADSNQVQVGDSVVAIGSPDNLQNTVTSGIVSALNRQVSVSESTNNGGGFPGFGWNGLSQSTTVTYNAIQTDASINPGNSGGPLLNMQGQVIGMDSAIYSSSTSSASSAGSVGLGFAIPSAQLQKDIAKIEAGGGDGNGSGNTSTGNSATG